MKIETGYLYHIKDEFFENLKENGLMFNHESGHSRPSYLAIKEKNILWFIPLSSIIDKYQKIIEHKTIKYGECKTIMIRKIAHRKQVILIQNAFPTIEKYIKNRHYLEGRLIRVTPTVEKEIVDNFRYMLSMKEKGKNLFFTDIDKIKEIMLNELTIGV